jgi:hypothetical protein
MDCACGQIGCKIPFGLCHCNCGNKTKPAGKTDRTTKRVKGVPVLYVKGHQGRVRPNIESAAPFRIDGVYCRLICLSKGFWTIVDEADYEWIMQWKWSAATHKKRNAVYAVRNSEQKNGVQHHIWLHREIMGIPRGDKREVDHENCNGIDNRRNNLRVVTHMENRWNIGKFRNNVSGYKCVWWEEKKQKWVAKIGVDGKYITLGCRDDPEDAYRLVCAAVGKYHKQFGRIA